MIYFDDTGSVGINTTTPGAWRLYVAGTACGTSPWGTCSDLKFKREIEGIENALDRILNLRGVAFRWKTEEYGDMGFPEGRHFGLIAQEAQETLPEIVSDGPEGEKSLTYTEIIPVLIESIKELKLENEALKQRIEALELARSR